MNDEETLKIIEKLEKDWKEHTTFGKKKYMDVLKRVKDSLENEEEREKKLQETMERVDRMMKDERMIYLSNLKD